MVAKPHLLAAVTVTLAMGLAGTTVSAAGIFTLKSTTFRDGAMLPKKVADSKANLPNNPNCVGDNVSPELSWTGAPDGTKSLAITVVDANGGGGRGFAHWVAYGIAPSVTGFTEGEVSKISDKYIGGKNGFGVGFFSGPCAPPGTSPHHYVFTLFATDLNPKDMSPGMTRDDLLATLGPPAPAPTHVKAISTLVGTFVNPWHE